MIRLIDRYLFAQLLGAVTIVLATLTALDGLFSFIQQLDDVGQGGYGHSQALLYIILTLPDRIYQYAPTSVLIGGLLSLGALAAQGELIALRAAGLSVTEISFSVLKAGFVFVIAIFLLGEFVTPSAFERAETLRSEALSGKSSVQAGNSVWMRSDGNFVRSKGVIDNQHMLEVEIFRFDGLKATQVIRADAAERTEAGWMLRNVTETRLFSTHIEEKHMPRLLWPNLVDEKMLDVLEIDPDHMSAAVLNRYIAYLDANQLDDRLYRLAFWNRFLQPLSSLVMLLIALPFVFGSQRTGGAGQRLFIGILLGIGYFLISRLMNQLGVVYGVYPFISAIAPVLLFLLIGLVMLRRI